MAYTWPTELDDAGRLLRIVGSFWAETYAGTALVESLLHAKAQAQAQAHIDLLELVAAVSRFTVPVFHTENWTLLVLQESALNAANLPRFDGANTFDSGLRFDTPQATDVYAWAVPPGLVATNVVMNRITDATVTYTAGADFFISDAAIWFRTNPFADPRVRTEQVFAGDAVVDRVAYLWAYRGLFDLDAVYTQFGYALGLKLTSSKRYRDVVNATFDGLVGGTAARTVEEFLSAACDVPLAATRETVQYVLADARQTWVITDKNAYGFSPAANPIVAVGDVVQPGDPLTDALQFYDLNRGTLPPAVRALSLGRGLLGADFVREIGFPDRDAPLIVLEDPGGYTRVEFDLTGWPADVEAFWDQTHARGVARGQTLAMLLDLRATRTVQPTALSLPLQVNPLKFLVSNVLRGNAFVVSARPTAFGPDAVGLSAARFLSKLVPPQTVCLLIVTLEYTADVVTMDGPGDADTPGYAEAVDAFLGTAADDEIDPYAGVAEDVRAYQIGGYCT